MCVVSMIMDHYGDKWRDRLPRQWPDTQPGFPYSPTVPPQDLDAQREANRRMAEQFMSRPPAITDVEIKEFRQLLERAREYDKRNNEPDCEIAEKRETVQRIAKQLGVEISFL